MNLIQPGTDERDDVLLPGAVLPQADLDELSSAERSALTSLQSSASTTSTAPSESTSTATATAIALTPELREAIRRANRVERGRRLFLFGTFGGNGRTCGTCHPPQNNFTIDVPFIAKLPATNPLFVAEFNAELAGLEDNKLLRERALILENLDGFDKPGVLRSVQHTLGLRTTIVPDRGTDTRPPFPLVAMTGWSGDGSPGDGSLRNFALGAIIQHMPKRLDRVPNVDFQVPTMRQLQAMEEFQLSLGRQEEIIVNPADPNALVFRDMRVEVGKQLFHAAPSRNGTNRACAGCHGNAGANDAAGNGRNFGLGVNLSGIAPVCSDPSIPVDTDGGFGLEPITLNGPTFCLPAAQAFGDNLFNTQSVVEAADTPEFFHGNIANTVEEAVTFYTTDTFNAAPAGLNNAFALSTDQINDIGAFLRAINILENIRGSNVLDQQALQQFGSRRRDTISLGIAETTDAIEVLSNGPIALYAGTPVLELLTKAREQQQIASRSFFPASNLKRAIDLKNQARAAIVN